MAIDPDTLGRISALSPQKQALLARRLRQGSAGDRAQDSPIGTRPPGPTPLSFAQQRLWFLDQLDPGSPHYNIPMAATIRGPVDAATMERALNVLARRHESLRTTFSLADSGPVQVVHDQMWVRLVQHDVSDLPLGERREATEKIVTAHSQEPFDLDTGPLVRAGLVRLGPEEHVLMASMHHIIADTWSIEIVLGELSVTYEALTHGQRPPLDDLPIQYADYAHWQRNWLRGEVLESQVEYWRRQLSGDLPLLDLPTDRTRPAQQSYRGAQLVHWLPAPLRASLDALGQSERVGRFTVFLAGLAALLYRYTGQDRVGVGTPVANRNRPELEGLVGYLSNTLLLRVDLSGAPTFRDLLKRAHETNLGALANQDLPFDKIVEIVQPERDLSRTPLIQVMFVFREVTRGGPVGSALPGLDEALGIDNQTAKFDLTFGLEANGDGYRLALEYSTDLFDEATIRRLAGHWESLLTAAAADPDRSIDDLPLLCAEEEHQIVTVWNRTDTDYPRDSCLHDLVERQVDRAPDAVAVVACTNKLTYGQLDLRANQLAHHLRARGAGPDIPIAVCMDKSLDLVVALLAILKAGSAYLPLDPGQPDERLALMLADAKPPVLLTQERLSDRLAKLPEIDVVRVDADWPQISSAPTERPRVPVAPDNLAYVIYTSGSTGRPKGVLLDHRGRVNNFADVNRRLGVGPDDCALALASIGFDMSAYDVFGTLMAGARLVLPEPGTERDPAHWRSVGDRHRVTIWHSVPALLEMFVELCESEPGQPFPPIRLALLGGDWIPLTLPGRLRALAPRAQVISLGGATEVSMDSTIYPVGEVDAGWRSIPYGMPMANQRCFVLDGRLRPVPVGVPGDLYLAGVGVARGYLNDPELTRRRFLPSPLRQWPHERLYFTGDRARYRADGNLELLGRSDVQIKIRGWRIEPGEVEAALRACPGVRQALVALTPDDGSPRRLVGYLVRDPDVAPDLAACRESLRTVLPDYMVPAVLVPLDAFPLTANGKIDRRNLPVPEAGAGASGPAYLAPRTRTERMLAEIWQELLGIDRVGVHDNFFAQGGDSITTIQVISRAKRTGIGLTPRQMFQHQTIAEQATVAEDIEMSAAKQTSGTPLAVPTGEELARLRAVHPDLVDAYPLPAMQRHMLRRELSHPRPGQYIIQVDYLFVAGGLDIGALEEAWQRVIRRHPTLRTSFHWEGLAEPVQIVHSDARVHVEQHDLSGLDVTEQLRRQDEIVRSDRERGFDLTRAPLLRLHLMRIADDTYKYLCTNHHIVLDGWSRAIVQQEVFAVYEALLKDEEVRLPSQTAFRDYVAWLRGRDPVSTRTFWRRYLEGFGEPTPLVRARGVRNPRVGPEFAKQRVPMSPQTNATVREFCRQHRLTANTVIQGAWLLVLSAYTGRDEVLLGVTSSGRSTEFMGADTVTGLCMNTLPVRARVDPGERVLDWLQALQARQVELRQYEHTSIEEVVGRDLVDLFECIMVFENYPWDGSLSNLASRVDVEHPMAQPDYQLAQFEFPLRVEVVPGSQTLLIMHYYPGTFTHETVTGMLDDWGRAVARLVRDPDQPVGAVVDTDAAPGPTSGQIDLVDQ